jgi:polycystin 2
MFVFMASAQAFVLTFGSNLFEFRNMTQSIYSLARMVLGDFDFESMRLVNPVLGPFLFGCFIVLAAFILLNM